MSRQILLIFLSCEELKGVISTPSPDRENIHVEFLDSGLHAIPKHNQDCAIQFMDYVIEKFPFCISTIRTDRGHEFQARFHWHVEDLGMRHVYIKPRTPQLNGKVERSHRTDQGVLSTVDLHR